MPTTWRRFASFEASIDAEIDGGWATSSPLEVSRSTEVGGTDGVTAAKIVTNGGNGGTSYARMKFEDGSRFEPGSEVWIGGSWYVPNPSQIQWSRLMNLGHFVGDARPENYCLGLVVHEAGQMSVRARYYDGRAESVLMANRPIPANRWFDVAIRFRLSPTSGEGLTEVYLDGERVSSSTAANMMHSGALHFYNAGLPYFHPGSNATVYFDAPRVHDRGQSAG